MRKFDRVRQGSYFALILEVRHRSSSVFVAQGFCDFTLLCIRHNRHTHQNSLSPFRFAFFVAWGRGGRGHRQIVITVSSIRWTRLATLRSRVRRAD
jgi:hypothetical protein